MADSEMQRRFKKRQHQKQEAKSKHRNCGDCQACCEILGVTELDKPHYTPCQHQCPTGCAIYQLRPKTCQIYECLWLSGAIQDEELRPDKLGIIFDAPIGIAHIENMIVAREIWNGAFDTELGIGVCKVISQTLPIYMIHHNGKRTLLTTDPTIAAKAKQIAEQLAAPKV